MVSKKKLVAGAAAISLVAGVGVKELVDSGADANIPRAVLQSDAEEVSEEQLIKEYADHFDEGSIESQKDAQDLVDSLATALERLDTPALEAVGVDSLKRARDNLLR